MRIKLESNTNWRRKREGSGITRIGERESGQTWGVKYGFEPRKDSNLPQNSYPLLLHKKFTFLHFFGCSYIAHCSIAPYTIQIFSAQNIVFHFTD